MPEAEERNHCSGTEYIRRCLKRKGKAVVSSEPLTPQRSAKISWRPRVTTFSTTGHLVKSSSQIVCLRSLQASAGKICAKCSTHFATLCARAARSGRCPTTCSLWSRVHQQLQHCFKAGCFEAIMHDLRTQLRLVDGRTPDPSAAIQPDTAVDSHQRHVRRLGIGLGN